MKPRPPRPRTRKAIKWGGAAVTLLFLVVWIGSGWRSFYWMTQGGNWAGVSHGDLVVRHDPAASLLSQAPGFHVRRSLPFRLGYASSASLGVWTQTIPLWIPTFVSLTVTLTAWHFDTVARRRERIGRCPKCGYDRAGLAADAKCPECGAAAERIELRQPL